jgi:hypothetical protein
MTEAAFAALRAARTEKSSPVWLRAAALPVAACGLRVQTHDLISFRLHRANSGKALLDELRRVVGREANQEILTALLLFRLRNNAKNRACRSARSLAWRGP